MFRQIAKIIRTENGDRKIPVVASHGSASWIDEEGVYQNSRSGVAKPTYFDTMYFASVKQFAIPPQNVRSFMRYCSLFFAYFFAYCPHD